MSALKSLVSVFAAWILLSACADENFTPYRKLGSLRVLGMKAAQPELDLGQSTSLEAVVSFATLQDQTLTHEVTACLDPSLGSGADASCDGAPTNRVLLAPTALTLTAPHYTEVVSLPAVNVDDYLTAETFASFAESLRYNGLSILVVYRIVASDGQSVQSSKSIRVSEGTKTVKNQNPSIAALQLDQQVLSAFPALGGSLTLEVNANEPTSEYTVQSATGAVVTLQEELAVTWFVSEGDLKVTRSVAASNLSSNEFTAAAEGEAKEAKTLVAVVRDGRGGSDVRVLKSP